jgi:hypothetical protein
LPHKREFFTKEAITKAGPLTRVFLAHTNRQLLAAGQDYNPTPLEVVERRWSGALLVEVWADGEGAARFRTVAFTGHRLELEFGSGVPPRSRRTLVAVAARALGYRVESVDGD